MGYVSDTLTSLGMSICLFYQSLRSISGAWYIANTSVTCRDESRLEIRWLKLHTVTVICLMSRLLKCSELSLSNYYIPPDSLWLKFSLPWLDVSCMHIHFLFTYIIGEGGLWWYCVQRLYSAYWNPLEYVRFLHLSSFGRYYQYLKGSWFLKC